MKKKLPSCRRIFLYWATSRTCILWEPVGFANSILQTVAYIAYLTIADANSFIAFGVGIIILFYPIRVLIGRARKYMHEIYVFSKHSGEEIQRIVDNMFLIKLLKKEEEEIENFRNTLETLNESD